MSTGKIELSVGAVKIADKYEIFTEEEVDIINNKIPELDQRVSVIEDEIEEINSSLDNITNYTKVIIKEKNNAPNSINEAINKMTNNANSTINFNSVNGVIELEAGIYEVDTIIMRSNITIKGQGIGKTIIKPKFSNINKYVFDVDGTDTNNRLVNFEIKDLSIMPYASSQYVIPSYSDRYLSSGINFTYCSSCRLTNVIISGFGGIGINQVENYDSNFTNIQVLGCGSDTHNSITFLDGTSDGCNAIHIDGFRIEGCSDILIKASNLKFQREIQFGIGKFESVGFDIKSTSNINFVGCHFTVSKNECIKLGKTDTTEKYGIKFVGCSFLSSGNDTLIKNSGDGSCEIVGCNFKTFSKCIVGSGFIINSNEFYDCIGNVIDITNGCIISNNKFIGCRGEGYLINVNGDNNIISFNKREYGSLTQVDMNNSNLNTVIWNDSIVFTSSKNSLWYAQNNYQVGNGIRVTHFGTPVIGGLKYDVNTKQLAVYDGTSFVEIPSAKATNIGHCNTAEPTDLQKVLNALITNLVSAGILK